MKITDTKERMDICRRCEFFNPLILQCKKCGCILPAKVRFRGQDCPIGKWEKVDEENLTNP